MDENKNEKKNKDSAVIKINPTETLNKLQLSGKEIGMLELLQNDDLINTICASNITPANTKPDSVKAAMLIGSELGLTPLLSIMLVNKLTFANVPKLIRGKMLGLDVIQSLDNIYLIPTSRGELTVIGNNILTGLMRKANIEFDVTEDCVPITRKIGVSKEIKGSIIPDALFNSSKFTWMPFDASFTQVIIDSIKSEIPNIMFYTVEVLDYRTTIIFKRRGMKDHTETFYYSQAVETGLTSKDNWKDKRIMMRHRCLGRGMRFVGGDKINDLYLPSEVIELTDANVEEMN